MLEHIYTHIHIIYIYIYYPRLETLLHFVNIHTGTKTGLLSYDVRQRLSNLSQSKITLITKFPDNPRASETLTARELSAIQISARIALGKPP